MKKYFQLIQWVGDISYEKKAESELMPPTTLNQLKRFLHNQIINCPPSTIIYLVFFNVLSRSNLRSSNDVEISEWVEIGLYIGRLTLSLLAIENMILTAL